MKNLFNRKYRLFTRKIVDVQNSIWEFEFKIAKARTLRESVRQERDRVLEGMPNLQKMIDVETDPAKKADLEKQKGMVSDSVKRYEAQMKMIDDQINGVAAEGENPGQQGIMDTISGLAELREMYKSYRKSI